MTENGKDQGNSFSDFTQEITQKGKNNGFTREQTKEGLDIGLSASDYDMAKWLRDNIQTTPHEVLNSKTLFSELEEQYREYLKNTKNSESEEETEEIGWSIPDGLFSEEPKKPTSKPKSSKSPKSPKLPKEKPGECRICEKNTFYSRKEFMQAHGRGQPEPSVGVYKTVMICKKPIITESKGICRLCKQEYHTSKCKYYSPVKPIISTPEPFDGENYGKWGFGVITLDGDSLRFFGETSIIYE